MVRSAFQHVCLAVFATAFAFIGAVPSSAGDRDAVLAEIKRILDNNGMLPLTIKKHAPILLSFYTGDGAQLLWLASRRADGLVDRMLNARYDGLDSADYPADFLLHLKEDSEAATAAEEAEVELWYSAHFLDYASDMKVGRILPSKVYPEFFAEPRSVDGAGVLAALTRFNDIDRFFAAWEPFNDEYRGLSQQLRRYIEIAENGGWPSVPPSAEGVTRFSGSEGTALAGRLAAEGLLTTFSQSSDGTRALDGIIPIALKAFQARYALRPTGNVDTPTLLAMNVPVERRIEQIALALERLRWMPETADSTSIFVNKGEGRLSVISEGRVRKSFEITLNCPLQNGVVAAGRIREIAINPALTVSEDYFFNRLLPRLREDPDAVARDGYVLYEYSTRQPLAAYPWNQFTMRDFRDATGRFSLHLEPGAGNPLGHLLFRADTAEEIMLFDLERERMEGECDGRLPRTAIGIKDAVSLAPFVLAASYGNQTSLEAQIESGRSLLYRPIDVVPIIITYQSAWLGEDNLIRFGRDIFREDQRLREALKGRKSQ